MQKPKKVTMCINMLLKTMYNQLIAMTTMTLKEELSRDAHNANEPDSMDYGDSLDVDGYYASK